MKKNDEQLWSAYLDGELSASEASAYDAQLTDRERTRMEAEMRLESAVADALRDEEACPTDVWKRIEQDVHRASERGRTWVDFATHWGVPAFAAAAGIILAVALFFPTGPDKLPPFLELAEAGVADQNTATPSELSHANMEDVLRQAGVDLSLTPEMSHHQMRFVAASTGLYGGRNFARIYYRCCGKPVKLLVTREGTPAAQAIEAAVKSGEFGGDTRRTAGYLIAAIGDPVHAPEVLSVVQAH